jgi:hypothetical protein
MNHRIPCAKCGREIEIEVPDNISQSLADLLESLSKHVVCEQCHGGRRPKSKPDNRPDSWADKSQPL